MSQQSLFNAELPLKTIRIVDLFSGVGGLSLGWLAALSQYNAELVTAIDSDPSLVEPFSWNFPATKFLQHDFGDPFVECEAPHLIKALALAQDNIDVLLAGPPCQTFSAAGKRQLKVESRLVYHVCDFAEALQPKIVLIENVPEFSRAEEGRLLGRVRVRLSAAGYITEVFHLNASHFGIPQTRSRCFTLAILRSVDWAGRRSFESDMNACYKPWTIREKNSLTTSVQEAIGDLPTLTAGSGLPVAEYTSEPTTLYQRYMRGSQSELFNHVAGQHSPELLSAMESLKPGDTPQDMPDHPLRKKDYYRGAYARLDPIKPAATMTTQTQNPGSGRFTHYRDNRVITVREVARLQGFPDWIRFYGTQSDQRRHAGNAVPPLLAHVIASACLPILE